MGRLLTRATGALIGVIAGASSLVACTGATTTQSCIDWVLFDTPAEAFDESSAVARGRVVDQAGTTTYLDIPVATWNVEVDEWLKGSGDDEIVVTSLPRSCGDTTDSMAEADGDVILFLREQASGWEIVTPWQGVIPATSDGGIPDSWPDDIDD